MPFVRGDLAMERGDKRVNGTAHAAVAGAWLAMVMGPPRIYPPLPWPLIGLIDVMEWVFVLYSLYTVAIPLAGFFRRRPPVRVEPQSRFAIVIPAHNEGRVLAPLIECCKNVDYPGALYDVYVIADNCEDDTAAVARAAGARVIVRTNHDQRGKGYALDYAFRKINAESRGYDAFVVFDADNLVHPDFLNVMNSYVAAGHQVIQGRMDAKNPTDSWISATFGMSVWVSNRFWFLAKHNIGFSSVLGGTGMCISTELVRQIGWGATSFTEDLEFTMKALLAGVKTAWAHDAICYDEKVLTFAASWKQRVRWVQGQATVARMYMGATAKRGLREAAPIFIEATFQMFTPFYLMLGTLLMLLGYVIPGEFMTDPILHRLASSGFWLALMILEYSLPIAAAIIDGLPRKALLYLPLYPVFLNSWVPLTWYGLLRRKPRHWTHTEHTRAMAYSELVALRAGRR